MTAPVDRWLQKLSCLRVDRASKSPAPHKPLLLLAIIDFIELGLISSPVVRLTPELAFRFLGYWQVVAERGRVTGKIELPFFHLKSDGFLRLIAHPGLEPALASIRPKSLTLLNQVIDYALLPDEFFSLMQDSSIRSIARSILISQDWFMLSEQVALRELLELEEAPMTLDGGEELNFEQPKKRGRDMRFRFRIVPTYSYKCAVCGVKALLPNGSTVVEAAHIHEHSKSKNDDPRNGMALCKNHHWSFDEGMWTLDRDFRVIVATGAFDESGPEVCGLRVHNGRRIDLSEIRPELRPGESFLSWHRNHQFIGGKERFS